MFINSRKIKYFKKCIISPAFEIILTISFLISLSFMSSFFLKIGKNLSNYKLTEIIKEEFEEDKFNQIKTKKEFLNYIDFLVNRLYEFDPINNNNSFPYYIPYGSIRLRKYDNMKCTEFYKTINESVICREENCTLKFLQEINNCGNIFKNRSSKIFGKFQGKYTKYDLTNEGEFIDFNIDDYYFIDVNNNNSKAINKSEKIEIDNKEKIERFIMEENSDVKFLVILFNVFFPKDKIYGNVLCGIEMTNYRNEIENPYNIFSVSIFGTISKKDSVVISFHIIFIITTILNFLKIILEIDSKFICSIHITLLFSEIFNLIIIFILFLYYNALNHINLIDLDSTNFIKDKILYTDKFIDFNYILNLKGYAKIIFSIIFLIAPFRIISLFSWYTTLSKLFVQFLGLIIRLVGLFLVNLVLFFGLSYTFIEINHNFYRNEINFFQTFYSTMISHFFFDVISLVKEEEYENREKGFSFSNSNFLIFNCIEKICIVYLIIMIISSFVSSLEKASQYEIEKEEDEILIKIKDIEEKLENEEENTDNNINNLKRQVLWFNLGNKNDIFINLSIATRQRMLLFTNSNQIISFLKYLFAIKPEMQFKNLRNKIGIVIQEKGTSNSLNNENIVNNIFVLLDWLHFVGCKIPILMYTEAPIEKELRMKFSHTYNFIKYTYTNSIIEIFIKGNAQDDEEDDFIEYNASNENKKFRYKKKELKQEKVSAFTLYKVKYIFKKKNKSKNIIKKSNRSKSKFNTNSNLNNIQIDNINQNKENKKTKSQKKESEKEINLDIISLDDNLESNKDSNL